MKTAFCEECRKIVIPNINEEKRSGKIKGVQYFYIGKVARCRECGSEVYMSEINDFNLEKLYKEYENARI